MRHRRSDLSRRQFLEQAGLGALAVGLVGCESMDRLILGKPRPDATVVILGAGVSGLAAGIELKKKKIPFVIVDAATGPGGRLRTLRDFGAEGEVLDLGGEWLSGAHTQILKLAKELRLELLERRPQPLDAGRAKDLASFGRSLGKRPAGSPATAQEWVELRTKDAGVAEVAREWCHFRFGAEPAEVAAIELDRAWVGNPAGIGLLPEARFRFRQGAGALTQALYERIGGVVPQENFLWGYRLLEVDRRDTGITLRFQTESGTRDLFAKRVICALPVGALKAVEGIAELEPGISRLKMGTQSKGGAFFAQRFWGARFDKGGGMGELPKFLTWESLRREKLQKGGALSFIQAGPEGADAGLHSIVRWREEMVQSLATEVPVPKADHVQNWSQLTLFRGSHTVFGPGVERDLFFRAQSQDWIWAGEHVSRNFPGTIEGAYDAGREAARSVAPSRVSG